MNVVREKFKSVNVGDGSLRVGPAPRSSPGTSTALATAPSRPGSLAWMLILVADAGILMYGILVAAMPSVLTAGYESYTGTSWTELVARAPREAAYLLWVYRLVGGLNVALGITLIAVAVGPFRRGERWAWFTLLGGNVMAFGIPMTYDQITGAIGAFEILEFAALGAVFVALALSYIARRGAQVTEMRGPDARSEADPAAVWTVRRGVIDSG